MSGEPKGRTRSFCTLSLIDSITSVRALRNELLIMHGQQPETGRRARYVRDPSMQFELDQCTERMRFA